MNDLEQYFRNNNQRLIFKWLHYFDIYDRHFSRLRNKEINILEIGVSQGGSLQMWKHYFGNAARIYGIDIDPRCKAFEEENVSIFIGSQADRNFLKQIKKSLPPIDILIDDGGHMMRQQIISFEELFDIVKSDGLYLIEDLHTSYWLRYGGGYKRKGSFIEYSKNFIDQLNAFHSEQNHLRPNSFTRSVASLHYYDSMVVIEKSKREKPMEQSTGTCSFEDNLAQTAPLRKIGAVAKNKSLTLLNKVLRYFRIASVHWK